MSTLPDFLVIGAMKAGTTTLCHDIGSHPEVFFPVVKEPHTLMLPEVLTPKGKKNYAALFNSAKAGQYCGEGSTGYTKLPDSADVPHRALEALGKDLKLVYILRNPVDRSISHHYHQFRANEAPPSFRAALDADPLIVSCSCYGLQLQAWLKVFPRENLHVIRFEDYMDNRKSGARAVWSFLGIEEDGFQLNDESRLNAGGDQKLPPPGLGRVKNLIARSQWYKRNIAPILSSDLKEKVKDLLYHRVEGKPEAPTTADLELLYGTFAQDLPLLRDIVGPEFPLWNVEELLTTVQNPAE